METRAPAPDLTADPPMPPALTEEQLASWIGPGEQICRTWRDLEEALQSGPYRRFGLAAAEQDDDRRIALLVVQELPPNANVRGARPALGPYVGKLSRAARPHFFDARLMAQSGGTASDFEATIRDVFEATFDTPALNVHIHDVA